jgi:hypothetical protein
MGGQADSSQAALFQEINLVGQSRDMGEFKRSRFFTPRPLKFTELAYKRREAGFVVLAVEPRPMSSPKGSLHQKNHITCHPRREVFIRRSRKPARVRVWRPVPLMTLQLAALRWYFKKK